MHTKCYLFGNVCQHDSIQYYGLRGAMVARLTPDQKVTCSNHIGVSTFFSSGVSHFYIAKNTLWN